MIGDIKVGDKVYCADYDNLERNCCWINGLIVSEIINERAICEEGPDGFSHKVSYLTTMRGEHVTPGDL